MSLTLDQLRVMGAPHSRKVTLSDLVEVLQAEGGEVVEVPWQEHLGLVNASDLVAAVRDNPGRYLVLRLPEDPQ